MVVLNDVDQEDVPLAYLKRKVSKTNQSKKKKKKAKKVRSFGSKKKKKSKKVKKVNGKVTSPTARKLASNNHHDLVPEDLSLGSRLPVLTSCTDEESDSLLERIQPFATGDEMPVLDNVDDSLLYPPDQRDAKCNNSDTANQTLPNIPPPKKKRQFPISSTYKRGSNGWEDCLRPRPAQVQHYQSIIIMRKRKLSPPRESTLHVHKEDNEEEKKSRVDSNEPTAMPVSMKTAKSSPSSPSSVSSLSSSSEVKSKSLQHQSTKSTGNKLAECMEALSLESLDVDRVEEKGVAASENSSQCTELEESGQEVEACVGDIFWAKLGSTRWWPALVIWGADCGQPPARSGQTWVFWFGDHKISELPRDKLLDFVANFSSKYSDFSGKMFKRGVIEATREVAIRAGLKVDSWDSSMILHWAKEGFLTKSTRPNPYSSDAESPIPEAVRKHLNRIKIQYLAALQNLEYQSSPQPRFSRLEQLENKDSALKKVREGKLSIQDVCIACDSSSVEVATEHPLIEGGLCKQCKDDIVETMFAYGDDGANAYCVICGQAGELLICDNNDCNRCYCTGCIEVLVSPGAHKKVLDTSPWLCYLCSEYDPELNGLIRRKEEWQQNVVRLFQPERHVPLPPCMDDYCEKRPIRVLSLFDGIGTGRFVLDQLGIEVDEYFASEIDQDAINVAIVQHRASIRHYGSIESITDSEVGRLCPIDLVIGGSPCNDLSLVNPARKGLYDPTGTGKLFFDFFRVLKAVQLANKGRHVFWLYENVASMPQEYKATITRFLQCEPSMIDSKYFSPQNRARYFWGNIPGMYTVEEYWSSEEVATPLQPHLLQQDITLESVLTPHLNRKASVEKIRTVTTRSNSLKQGKKCILPVTMNGEADVLWVTELEQVFGFPRHYTDAGNIPLGRRQQLLGKAWSVPVIKHLFTPLRNFFKTTSSSALVTTATATTTATTTPTINLISSSVVTTTTVMTIPSTTTATTTTATDHPASDSSPGSPPGIS